MEQGGHPGKIQLRVTAGDVGGGKLPGQRNRDDQGAGAAGMAGVSMLCGDEGDIALAGGFECSHPLDQQRAFATQLATEPVNNVTESQAIHGRVHTKTGGLPVMARMEPMTLRPHGLNMRLSSGQAP